MLKKAGINDLKSYLNAIKKCKPKKEQVERKILIQVRNETPLTYKLPLDTVK